MSNFTLPMQQVNSFFETYAKALEQYDTKGMAFLHNVPCTMISDDTTSQYNDVSKLEGFFNTGAAFYRQFGIAHVRPEVWTRRAWTNRIINVKVNWYYMDVFKNPIYDCENQYVLKLDKHSQWKIMLSVSVNEKEKIEEWKEARLKG
jgi:hypothetical protein